MIADLKHGRNLSTNEAAGMLGVTVQYLRLLARNGEIKGRKDGRDWFFEPGSVLKFGQERHLSSKVDATSPSGPAPCFGGSVFGDANPPSRIALHHGDAATILRQYPDSSIHTCITSPPYWQARDYGDANQIGLESSLDDYIGRLVETFTQVHRVLRDDGSVWLNLGDSYFTGSKAGAQDWQKNKQLLLTPFRVAIALQESGWFVRNSVVWHKPNAMPASVRDRLANNWEPIFLLTKSNEYFFDLDKIRVPHKTCDSNERRRANSDNVSGKAQGQQALRKWLNSPRHRATIDGLKEVRRRPNAPSAVDLASYLKAHLEGVGKSIKWVAQELNQPFERVRHYFRTDKIGARLPPEPTWERLKLLLQLDSSFDEAMAIEIGDNVFRNHPNGRNPGDVYSASVGANEFSHFAVMPDKLAQWCLSASLPEDGICLDPFAGICTSGRATLGLGGRFVGIDVNRSYLSLGFDILADLL